MRDFAKLLFSDVRLRFIVAGTWNTAFSWLMFALAWWALASWTSLWVISGVAHLAATTQSFFAQRHFVFRATALPVWAQYFKFQWAYLGLLICGSFAVNALSAQGFHPLVAQLMVFALLAVCGFVLGKNFIYDSTTWSFQGLVARTAALAERHSPAIVGFLLCMLLFEAFWGVHFYGNTGKVGADFDLTAASLLEGKFWLDSNGLMSGLFNPPWFTPAWCGGAAFYADPQFIFYSPLQFLAYLTDPFTAAHWTSLLFAAVAFWGCYAVALRVLGWRPAASVIFATLGTANAFLPEHSMLGQLGYQPLYLWTWLVLALCYPRSQKATSTTTLLWPSIGVALSLTGWVQFGFGGMLIPASLATLLFCLVLVVQEKARPQDIFLRGLLGSAVALALNGAKIYEGLSLLRNFPRDFYAMYGQSTVHESILMILRSLFQPSAWSASYMQRAVARMNINPVQPEWAFQFGMGALVLLIAGLVWLLVLHRRVERSERARVFNLLCWVSVICLVVTCGVPMIPPPGMSSLPAVLLTEFAGSALPILLLIAASGAALLLRAGSAGDKGGPLRRDLWIAWAGICLVAAIPIVLVYASDFRELIKQLPVLNTTTWTMRWTVVYVPVAQLLIAWPIATLLDRWPARWGTPVALGALVLVWMGPALAPMGYYDHPWVRSYNADPMTTAFVETRKNGKPIPIESIHVRWYRWMYVGRNDFMLGGISQGLCYNPIYGYLLEGFPQLERLEHGPVLKSDLRGQSLLRNPACLVHPAQNACEPGDGFTLADPGQMRQAQDFLDRKPMEWRRPWIGAVFSVLSQLTYWVLLAMVVLRLWRAVLHQPPPEPRDRPESPPTLDAPEQAAASVLADKAAIATTTRSVTFSAPYPSDRKLTWMAFLLSLLVFEFVWGRRFYSSLTHLGHDFALTATGLVEGRNWIYSNGWLQGLLNPPWFTPAWCAGTAFYADPQSAFYSTLQFFAIWLDPFQATHLNTLLFAALAFWSCFLLARRVFLWSSPAAVFFAVLGMSNTFLPWRSAVGEAGYQPLYIWALLTAALCWPARALLARWTVPWPSLLVGLCLTAWLQAGFAGMMVPAFLGAIALCMVMVLTEKVRLSTIVVRSCVGAAVAILLNASKLYESISLMRNFPRDFYGIPGFESLRDALVAIVLSLIQPSEWTAHFGMRHMTGMQFTVLPHEWSLNFGVGALAVALGALAATYWLGQSARGRATAGGLRVRMRAEQWFALAVLLLCVCIPVLLLWNEGGVRAAIKQIPILNSTAWPMRWIVIYLPVAQWALAWPLQRILNLVATRWAPAIVVLCSAIVWAGPLMEPNGYYASDVIQSYDPHPAIRAHARTSAGGAISINRVELPRSGSLGINRNDSMFEGASQGACYNPIYGYRLEGFPQPGRLQEGPALEMDADGQSLIYNAACLVHPEANACKPGDGFRMSDASQAQQAAMFVARKPFDWKRPALGTALSWASQLSWLLLLLAGLFKCATWLRRRLSSLKRR